MSEDQKGVSDTPTQETSGESREQNQQTEAISDSKKDYVAYDTYRRTLTEAKKAKTRLQELEEENLKMRESQLEAEGKKDELIEALRKQNAEISGKYKQTLGTFAYKTISSEIVDEAVKMGCTNTKLLMKAVEEDLKTLDYDDNFNVDREQVKSLLEKTKQEHGVLFNKPAPSVKDGVPASPELKEDNDLSKIPLSERINMLARLDRTGKL